MRSPRLPRSRHLIVAILVACGCAPWQLSAQQPTDRMVLGQADARVGRDEPMPAGTGAEDKTAQDIVTGLAELDAFVLRDDRRALERALERFARASARRPDWGWPEYALAHAFLLLHDTRSLTVASAGTRLGEDHVDALWRHLELALRRDPDLGPARALASDLIYQMGDRILTTRHVALLRSEVSHADPRASALIAWSRHQRNSGEPELALAILEAAHEAGGDRSVVALERAYALAALGQLRDATRAYYDGLSPLTVPGRDRYLQGLAWVESPEQFAALTTLPDDEVARQIANRWGGVAGALERHLVAWSLAHHRYRAASPAYRARRGSINHAFDLACGTDLLSIEDPPVVGLIALPGDLRHDESLLDVRGQLLLLHGPPAIWIGRSVTPPARDVPAAIPSPLTDALQDLIDSYASEAWIYPIPRGFRLYALQTDDPRPLGGVVVGWDLDQARHAVQSMMVPTSVRSAGAACPLTPTGPPALSQPDGDSP